MAVDRLRPDKVKRPLKVLFDSSFLIAVMERPTTWREDILERVGAFEGVVIEPVYSELRNLAAGGGRRSGFARLALGLLDDGKLRLERTNAGRADEELVSYALQEGAVVASIDAALIKRLEALHVPVLSLSRGRVEAR